jgi:hypothetical protein
MRLRSILRGAMATPVAAPDESDKKAILKRVLARTQHMDRNGVPPPAPELPPSRNTTTTTRPQPPLAFRTANQVDPAAHPSDASPSSGHANRVEEPVSRQMDRIESHASALDFRHRLRKLTTQRATEGSHPQPSGATTFLDEKTREMIQRRFRQRQTAISSVVITNNEEKEHDTDDDSELEGYDTFFETLKNEVHGQHSLVSLCFAIVPFSSSGNVSNDHSLFAFLYSFGLRSRRS